MGQLSTPSVGQIRSSANHVASERHCTRPSSSPCRSAGSVCSSTMTTTLDSQREALTIRATCVTAPSARGKFGAIFGASSGADMCPASVMRPSSMPRARMVFEDWVQIKAACSKALCCTLVLPIPSHDYCAKLLLALSCSDALAINGQLMPPRPETCRRRPGPSRPRRSAPFYWQAQPAPASQAFATAGCPAMYRVVHPDENAS